MFRRVVSLAVAFAALVAVARAQTAGKTVSYSSGSEKVSGYLSAPAGSTKKPALVVIQEWWGLNDFIKRKADEFSRQGYVALAVDLYRGKVTADPDTAHQLMRGMPEDRAMRDLQAAVAYLRSRPDVDGKRIGSIGWCMGGGYSLALALAEPTLAASVIYYGRLVTDDAKIAGLNVPLLGNFGGKDQGIPPESVREFERKAKTASTPRATRKSFAPRTRRTPTRAPTHSSPGSWEEPGNGKWETGNEGIESGGADRFSFPGLRFTSLVPVRVDLKVVLPFVRDRLFREDGRHGTGGLAVAALNADIRVDVEHLGGREVRLVLSRVDAVDGAHIDARGVFCADAWLSDDVHPHEFGSLLKERWILAGR